MSTPLTLETPRLFLTPVVIDDATELFEFKGNEEVTAGYGQEPHPSVEDTIKWITRCINGEDPVWTIRRRGEEMAIGSCCLWNLDKERTHAELGYELRRDQWRKGFMAEALEAVLAYGFGTLDLHRVEALPMATNQASIALLAKLGFHYEGLLRQRILIRGGFVDQALFSLLSTEWEQRIAGR
jgi:[ribosomal protein S5]-alanine N-acetyltransferase